MKKLFVNLAIALLLFAGIVDTSCQSQAEKKEEAHDKVLKEENDLKEARQEERLEAEKASQADEWKTFRYESEAKIRDLENRIAELQIRQKKPGKALDQHYERRINDMEHKIREMRTRMDHYDTGDKSDWESFKREFNHDMEEIGRALKDLTVDNEK